jgi:hypothetical protein
MARTIIAFPLFLSVLGGVQSVQYTSRFAWITKADSSTVRVPLSKLPPVDRWTAFNLADAVAQVAS